MAMGLFLERSWMITKDFLQFIMNLDQLLCKATLHKLVEKGQHLKQCIQFMKQQHMSSQED